MSTNGKQFLTIQVAILAVFGAIIVFTFQLMDTKVERSVELTVKLMERVSALEARTTYDEQRLDRVNERLTKLERQAKPTMDQKRKTKNEKDI